MLDIWTGFAYIYAILGGTRVNTKTALLSADQQLQEDTKKKSVMPQHKSCEKRVRTSTKARLRNRRDRSQCRNAQKRVLESQDKQTALTKLSAAYDLLDRMTAKRVLPKNTVARRKARLARHVNTLSD